MAYQHLTMLVCVLIATSVNAQQKITPRLHADMQRSPNATLVFAWVYFSDKGEHGSLRLSIPANVVSARSLHRRSKVRQQNALVDYDDLPLSQAYVDRIAEQVPRVRNRSKWLNAVSVEATKDQVAAIAELSFVTKVDLMARFARGNSEHEQRPVPAIPSPLHISLLDYGPSFGQNNQINVPAVHGLGYNGSGVVVGVFDNGFRLLTHEVFDTLRPRIIATYDYVDHKVSVVPNNPSPSFGSHGVNTLSTIGGFKSGQLIGPAYGANYILARTENDSSETPIEEDNWVAAIEWADSIGVDVTSTSLGYLTYDPPYTNWTWQDMNGSTTAITRAADAAAGRGILIVNSAGNNGFNASHNTLNAPADGDSVLSIGAVDAGGTRASFSSVGPTTGVPARIKPDVMAQGINVIVASSTNTTGYAISDGTSFSCPLAAGVAALIVHARPNATPIEIMNAMRNTANRAATPDNLYGWGIVNAFAALNELPLPIQLEYFRAHVVNTTGVRLTWRTISEMNNFGFFVQQRGASETAWNEIPDSFTPGHGTTNVPHVYQFTHNACATGTVHYRLRQVDLDGTSHLTEPISITMPTDVESKTPNEFSLFQNYPNPNPSNPTTTVSFDVGHTSLVSLTVYDVLGREVATLVNEELQPKRYQKTFDATNLASGTYYYRLRAGDFVATRKLTVLK